MSKRLLTTLLGIGTAAFVVTASHLASASTSGPCTPTIIGWDDSAGGGSLNIECGGHKYAAWRDGSVYGGATAPDISANTLKIWYNLAQSAMLSGKNLEIVYSSCNGHRCITWMQLDK